MMGATVKLVFGGTTTNVTKTFSKYRKKTNSKQ